jgi:hypothetical protein
MNLSFLVFSFYRLAFGDEVWGNKKSDQVI